jgi:hypothetical protein
MAIMRQFKPEQLRSGSYSITGSFSGSFFGNGTGLFTGSFSGSVSSNLQDITDNGATTTNAITASGLQTPILTVNTQTSISGTVDITGSAQLNNSPIVTEAILYPFTASYYVDSASFDTRILNNSSSIDLLSGSFIGFSGSYVNDSSSFDTRILANSSSISSLSGSYLTDSASFDTRILNNSASIDVLSGSFTSFSSSYLVDSSSFNTRIINNSSSISTLSGSFIGFSSSYTIDSASFDTRITNNSSSILLLSGSYLQDSASFNTRILNNSASIDLLSGSFIGFSGSYLIDSSSFDTRILNNSSSISLLSGSYLTDSASFNSRITDNSASISLLSGSYLQDSASFNTRILNNSSSISTLSGSFIGFSGSYLTDSASFNMRVINNSSSISLLSGSFIGFSGSYVNDSSSFDARILSNSSSLSTFSGSYVLDSASFDTRILSNSSSIDLLSGSFDSFTQTYNTGSFTGSFTGSLFGTASWAINAQTASYVLPLNQDVLINGSLNVTSSFTASGLIYPPSDNGEESFIQTDGNGNLSLQYVKTIYEEIVNGESTQLIKGTPVYVSGSQGAASIVFRADPLDPTKMPVVYIAADTLSAGEAGRGIALGLIKGVDTTGFPAGTEIYLAAGGGFTASRPTGSAIVQVLGYVTKEGSGGQGVVLNPGPANLPNLPSSSIWVGNSDSIPVAVLTSSLSVASASFASSGNGSFTGSFTGSFIGDGAGLFNIPASGIVGLNLSQITSGSVSASISPDAGLQVNTNVTATSFTGSLFGTASWANNAVTASFVLNAVSSSFASTASYTPNAITTASISGDTITFTKGDSSTFPITVPTGSGGSGSAFPYTGSAQITGSLGITGSFSISSSVNTISGSVVTIYGSGSAQPVFVVNGSQGELFSITDSLSGSLFSVNDISGLPILEVFSDGTTLIGDYQDPMLITTKKVVMTNSGSFTVYSLPTASYDTAFYDYSIRSGSNARAGQIMAIQSGSSVIFTETTTTDFGNTAAVSFTVIVSGSNMVLTGSASAGIWTTKCIIRGI